MIILDTDVLIEIFDKNSEKGDEALRLLEESGEDIAITSLNLHEILYGLYKYAKVSKIERVKLLDTLEFGKDDAVLSSKLELEGEKKGKKITRFDAMIAAIAINRNSKIFTFNRKHFEVFEELKLL